MFRVPAAPHKRVDRFFLIAVLLLIVSGTAIFSSAALGLLAREGGPSVASVIYSQLVLGLVFGGILCFLFSRIDYRVLRRISFPLFITALFITALVFIPGLGFEYGGAKRWLHIFGHSFQPAELLKFAVVAYFAALLAASKDHVRSAKGGLLPLFFVLTPVAILLGFQPDLGTFGVITFAVLGMFFAAGAKKRHLALIFLVGIIALAGAAYTKPYAMERIKTMLDPTADPQGAGYQLMQSQNAIGSGGVLGRGFGQSLQKFRYLPEPMGDSIFAVFGEEFGLIGMIILLILYITFAARGLSLARRSPDRYGGLMVVGIVILIVSQSFINIASMIGLFPLTGMPLVFVSQGGTALMAALAEVGIILSISRSRLAV